MCPVSPRIQWLVGFWWLAGILYLTGCASVIPEALEKQVDREVQFSDLQRDPAHYQGRLVVLGGQIYALRSSEQVTELEVTEFPLRGGSDSPRLSATSSGRFLVAHEGRLDPELYRPGRPVTVVGLVHGGRISPGQDVPKPVLEPKYVYLWPDRPPIRWFNREPLFLFPRRRFHRHFCD